VPKKIFGCFARSFDFFDRGTNCALAVSAVWRRSGSLQLTAAMRLLTQSSSTKPTVETKKSNHPIGWLLFFGCFELNDTNETCLKTEDFLTFV
jgi:hypothetical protein